MVSPVHLLDLKVCLGVKTLGLVDAGVKVVVIQHGGDLLDVLLRVARGDDRLLATEDRRDRGHAVTDHRGA